ncbi:MAG TPA: HEAT repeat domain-containing protein, partial [Gemmataceae bacterium]|nr:HEAT repeat domain-containing protein [Gemmataceae bacterium]
RLARLHAIWGLGQFDLEQAGPVVALTDLLKDNDAEVRAQAARSLGTLLSKRRTQAVSLAKVVEGLNALTGLLKDGEPHVRFLASVGLSKLGTHYFGDLSGDQDVRAGVVAAARAMLRDNDDRDPYLRHAGVLLLTAFGPDAGGILKPLPEPTPPERLAMVLAYRRQAGHRYVADHLARFLADTEPHIVAEAARAIHDEPVPKAFSQLAALVEKPKLPETVLYRALNANFRLGKVENAVAVAKFSARGDAPEALRVEALQMLGEWSKPGRRDRVTGLTQDLGTRPVGLAAEAIKPSLGRLFSGPNRVRQEAARVASKLGIREVGPVLVEMLGDRKRPAEVRVEALRGLDALRDARLQKAVDAALDDEEPLVRSEGRRVLARLNPDASLNLLEKVLREGDALPGKLTPEQKRRADRIARQGAFDVLGAMGGAKAETLLSRWLDRLLAKEVESELRLDLLEAARALSTPALKEKVARYEAARPKNDSLAPYRDTLTGGSTDEGRRIFLNKAEVSCLRCHKLNGEGGDVGPDLAGIGSKQTREYLLESLVEPSKQIARGFETVVLTTSAGKVVSGIIKAEDKKSVRLITAEGKLVTIAVKDIEDRQTGKSAMPDDLVKHLSPRELRDLVEFLAELKETKK